MVDIRAQVISEVEVFLSETGMAPSTLGVEAFSDSKVIPRILKGGNPTLKTVERLLAYIEQHRANEGMRGEHHG